MERFHTNSVPEEGKFGPSETLREEVSNVQVGTNISDAQLGVLDRLADSEVSSINVFDTR